MAPNRSTLLVIAFLSLAVLSAGCLSALDDDGDDTVPGNESVDVTAEELRTEVSTAMEDVSTASFTLNTTVLVDGNEETATRSEGVMNLDENRLYQELAVSLPVGGNEEVTQYIINQTIYTQRGDQWIRQDPSGVDLWEQNELQQQQTVTESAGNLEVVRQTGFEGNEVFVLTGDIDPSFFENLGQQRPQGDLLQDPETRIVESTFTQYVDTETSHVRYFEMNVVMEANGQEVTTWTRMTFDAFDEAVDIDLPDGAKDAEDIGQGP